MANGLAGLLAVFVYFGLVVASPVVALVAWALSKRDGSFRAALGTVAAGSVGLLVAGAAALALFVDVSAGLAFAGLAFAGVLVLGVFPVVIGQQLLGRWTRLAPDEALEYATLGWPVATVMSALLFVAPGGLGRYNILFLDGFAAALAWLAVFVVVTLGPAVVGLGFYHVVERYG